MAVVEIRKVRKNISVQMISDGALPPKSSGADSATAASHVTRAPPRPSPSRDGYLRARASAAVRAAFAGLPGERSVMIDGAVWLVMARNPAYSPAVSVSRAWQRPQSPHAAHRPDFQFEEQCRNERQRPLLKPNALSLLVAHGRNTLSLPGRK